MNNKSKAIEILEKWEFFYGQRAGRELWADKPTAIQNMDIEQFNADLRIVRDVVNNAADVAPVVLAHFNDGECTNCGWFGDCVDTPYYRYCPNCGAKMDGERRNDEQKTDIG